MSELEGAVNESSSSSYEPVNQSSRLLSLPPELIDHIFSLAALQGGLPSRPLCKALLPFFRRHEWALVTITSTWSLQRFVFRLAREPDVAPRVRALKITFSDRYINDEAMRNDLECVFRLLAKLNTLSVKGRQELWKAAFLHGYLARLSKLEMLDVDWYEDTSTLVFRPTRHLQPPRKVSTISLPSLTSLAVTECVKLPNLDFQNFLTGLVGLSHLSLQNLTSLDDLSQLMRAVPDLSLLRSLTLNCIGGSLRLAVIDSIANELTSLSRLSLSGAIEHRSREFFTALPPSSLTYLRLGPGISPDAQFWNTLLDNKGVLPSLEYLTLDMLDLSKVEAGLTAAACISAYEHEPQDFDESWRLPPFHPPYDRPSLEALVLAAEAGGLTVDGTVVEALKIDDEYVKERNLLKRYFVETRDKRGEAWLSDSEDEDSEYEP
ncbi:hypothetical protein JCM8097_004779 [Rhodosporidiobolus ruineniae]